MPARPKRRALYLAAALGCTAIGGVALALVTVLLFGTIIVRVADPVTAFNPGIDHTFTIPSTDNGYVISMWVDTMAPNPRDFSLTLTTVDGTPVASTERTGRDTYITMFGNHQRMIVDFDPLPEHTTYIVRAEADPNERFIINRKPRDVDRRVRRWANPARLAAIATLMLGLGLLTAFFVTSPDTMSDISDQR